MQLSAIGIIHTPHRHTTGTPVQAAFAQDIPGTLELLPQYTPGLQDLDGFDRAWLFYWFNRASEARMVVTPYLDTQPHGIFATRSPSRPNPIGFSCVQIRQIKGNLVHILGADMLDGTPLLDIKPYVPAFDTFQPRRIGWFANVSNNAPKTADDRFEAKL